VETDLYATYRWLCETLLEACIGVPGAMPLILELTGQIEACNVEIAEGSKRARLGSFYSSNGNRAQAAWIAISAAGRTQIIANQRARVTHPESQNVVEAKRA
jgi:hypothetical protein